MEMTVIVISVALAAALAFLVWASACIRSGVYLKALCHVDTSEKVVFLTFDDGPVRRRTGMVLDVLQSHGARAVFFLVGKNISGNEDLLQRIHDDGHLLGIHSLSHTWDFPLKRRDDIAAELKRTGQAIGDVTGQPTILFRPPFGVTSPPLAKAVRDCGLITVGWDVRSYDTVDCSRPGGLRKVADRVLDQVRPGAVILLHDRLEGSADLLEMILEGLDAREFRYDLPLPYDHLS